VLGSLAFFTFSAKQKLKFEIPTVIIAARCLKFPHRPGNIARPTAIPFSVNSVNKVEVTIQSDNWKTRTYAFSSYKFPAE
jgi:hypothetical protein